MSTRVTKAEAQQAIAAYKPEEDFRVWQTIARMWKGVAMDMAEIASGLEMDGKPHEIAARLNRELQDRINQEAGEIQEAKNKFAKIAFEAVERTEEQLKAEAIMKQNNELAEATAKARASHEEHDRLKREEKAKALEEEAARIRAGKTDKSAIKV